MNKNIKKESFDKSFLKSLKIEDSPSTREFLDDLPNTRKALINRFEFLRFDIIKLISAKTSYKVLSKEEEKRFENKLMYFFMDYLFKDVSDLIVFQLDVSKNTKKNKRLAKDLTKVLKSIGHNVVGFDDISVRCKIKLKDAGGQ